MEVFAEPVIFKIKAVVLFSNPSYIYAFTCTLVKAYYVSVVISDEIIRYLQATAFALNLKAINYLL